MLDAPHPCVEVLAVAFEDTILGVDLVDARAPAYSIGEGPNVRMPVPGVGLPDAAGFELVRIEAGLAWLSWTASMRGALLDHGGPCSLEALAADGARMLSLERGQTVWIAYEGVRFRVRLVEREAVRASRGSVDWPHLGALLGSAVLGVLFMLLLRAQPPMLISTHTGGRREGVVGWGSYGPVHGRLASWRETGTDRHATFGSRERRASPIVQVRIGTLDIRGTMDPDLARRIVRAHGHELRGCYGQAVSAPDAAFNGTIELSVNGGKVGAIVIDAAFPSELADCMRGRMRAWRFPTGSSVGTHIVTFPLRMSR